MFEHDGPRLFVPLSQFFIGETGVREPELRSTVGIGCEVHGDDSFKAIGCGGKPCEFHETISFEPQEAAIVRMPRSLELRLEKENRIDLAGHQHRSWDREPAIELLRPRPI